MVLCGFHSFCPQAFQLRELSAFGSEELRQQISRFPTIISYILNVRQPAWLRL